MPKYIHPVQRISASDTVFQGTVRITGGANITVGTDASGVTISGAAAGGGSFTGGMSNIGNTIGTTGTVASQMLVVGGPNVTASQSINGNSATVSLSVAAQTYATHSFWHNSAMATIASIGAGNTNGTIAYWPIAPDQFVTATQARIHLSQSTASGSTGALSLYVGIYSYVNSTKISSVSSASQTYSWTSSTNAGSNWGGYGSARGWTVPLNVSMTPGDYVAAAFIKTTNAGTYSIMCASDGAGYGGDIGVASNASHQAYPFQGSYSAASNVLPDTVGRSDIVGASGSSTSRSARFILLTNI